MSHMTRFRPDKGLSIPIEIIEYSCQFLSSFLRPRYASVCSYICPYEYVYSAVVKGLNAPRGIGSKDPSFTVWTHEGKGIISFCSNIPISVVPTVVVLVTNSSPKLDPL